MTNKLFRFQYSIQLLVCLSVDHLHTQHSIIHDIREHTDNQERTESKTKKEHASFGLHFFIET